MNNTVRYVLIVLFAVLGVARLYGVVAYYNQYQQIDWWKLVVGVVFIVSAVFQYIRIRKNVL